VLGLHFLIHPNSTQTMLYDRDWNGLPAHAQHSKGVRAQVSTADSRCYTRTHTHTHTHTHKAPIAVYDPLSIFVYSISRPSLHLCIQYLSTLSSPVSLIISHESTLFTLCPDNIHNILVTFNSHQSIFPSLKFL
jgi:hypothetical protein